MKTTEKSFTFRIDSELLQQVTAATEAVDMTNSQLVRRLLRKWLDEGGRDLVPVKMAKGRGE